MFNVPQPLHGKRQRQSYLDAADIDHGAARKLVVFLGHEVSNRVETTDARPAHGTRYRHLVEGIGTNYERGCGRAAKWITCSS